MEFEGQEKREEKEEREDWGKGEVREKGKE
jgi:hypothetical protein